VNVIQMDLSGTCPCSHGQLYKRTDDKLPVYNKRRMYEWMSMSFSVQQ